MSNYDVNGLELEIKEIFPKVDYTTIGKILDSKTIPKYNPFFEFFAKYIDRGKQGSIDDLFDCISTNTGDGIVENYAIQMGKKWLVGMIAGLYEDVSPLMLILCGTQHGTGKSYFFEHLLPAELQKYFSLKKSFLSLQRHI